VSSKTGRGEALVRALYANHGPALLLYVQRLLGGDRPLAEDLVQETLVRAWRHADELTVEAARPWLFTVARNLAVDARRARSVRPTEVAQASASAIPDELAAEELDAALDSYLVADALATLSPTHREVITAAFFQDKTVAQIAAEQHVPAGTVRSRLFYGMRALRLALQERGVQAP
jgi:RNA polymerase sigma-70 factor (ECF subfamily)